MECFLFVVGVFMLNIIWSVMIISSFVSSFFLGTTKEVGDAVFKSCEDFISFILKTGSFMVMWSGFIGVCEKSGLSEKTAKIMSPVIRRIFSGIKKGSEEERLICTNVSANLLGLSNAATPLGIKAMKKLSEKSKTGVATNNLCMLAVLNCASLQIVPSTLIAIRSSFSSENSAEITVPIWITSLLTVLFAVIVTKIFERCDKNR